MEKKQIMRNISFSCAFFCLLNSVTYVQPDQELSIDPDQLQIIDTIKAIVFNDEKIEGKEKNEVITLSDVTRPSLDGSNHTLDDLVLEKLIFQDAMRFRMLPGDDAIDKHLKAVQRENNLSLDDLKTIFRNGGYTYEEGRDQFKIMTSIGTMLDFRIKSRLIVPEKDIIAYYNENPVLQEASYQIERAVIVCPEGMGNDIFKVKLQQIVETGKSELDIEWSEPFWINQSDIAQDKIFLTKMAVGAIAISSESAAGNELFKLINKKEECLKSLESRYSEIADILKRPKYQELFLQYKTELFDKSPIVYYETNLNKE